MSVSSSGTDAPPSSEYACSARCFPLLRLNGNEFCELARDGDPPFSVLGFGVKEPRSVQISKFSVADVFVGEGCLGISLAGPGDPVGEAGEAGRDKPGLGPAAWYKTSDSSCGAREILGCD
jgi:hypothetical protein